MNHILKDYLSAAGIKHTHLYADNVFYSNPNRENLLGLKQMLSHYGIEMQGFRVAGNNIKMLSLPCILHVKDDISNQKGILHRKDAFVVVTQYNDTHIIYIEEGRKHRENLSIFGEKWDGYVLMPCPQSSIPQEPDYKEHRRKERMEQLPLWGGALVTVAMMVLGNAFASLASAVMVLLAMLGFVFSFFLAEKEVKGESRIGDRLCRALGEGACGNNRKYGKIWGDWTLSEVGLGYFGGQMLALAVLPDAYMAVTLISMFALLFCPWSIVVQWKMKRWCVLCLGVVTVLVIQGALSVWSISTCQLSNLQSPSAWADQLSTINSLVVLLMALSVMLAHLVARGERNKREKHRQKWAFQTFRDDRAIFETRLRSKAIKPIEEGDITRHEGNADAPHRLTLVTAAECPYCQAITPRVKQLIQQCHTKFSIDYVVLSDMTDERRMEFVQRTGIHSIPTLLVDGYELPDTYEVEELFYI